MDRPAGQAEVAGELARSVADPGTALTEEPLLQPPSPEVDRQIVIWSPGPDSQVDFERLLGCDEVLWLLEPGDAAATSQDLRRVPELFEELSQKVRIVWLLDANTPVAPLVSRLGVQKGGHQSPCGIDWWQPHTFGEPRTRPTRPEHCAAFRWVSPWLGAVRKAWPTSACCRRWNRRDCRSTSCRAPVPVRWPASSMPRA